MEITVTRIDPMAGIPDSHDPAVITKQSFSDWPKVFDYIRSFGVNLLPLHEEEIRNHLSTQFSNREFLNAGHTACEVSVMYDVTITTEGEIKMPKMLMNPCTGSVDTEENWLAEMKDWETATGRTQQEQFDSLVEVVQDKDGNWVSA